MKTILTVLFLLAGYLVNAQDSVVIKGEFQNLNGHQLILAYKNGNKRQYEKIAPRDGKFEIKLNISEMQEVDISPYRYPKTIIRDTGKKFYYVFPSLKMFANPGDQIQINGDGLRIWDAKVKGGRYEKEYDQFRILIDPLVTREFELKTSEYKLLLKGDSAGVVQKKKELKALSSLESEEVKRFYTGNTKSIVGIYKLLQNISSLQPYEIKVIYNSFSPELKQSALGKRINQFIEKDDRVGPGMQMLDFSGRTLAGKELNTKDLRGKYVLLDFWGSWCGPCRKSNPHLKKLYARYKNRGFEILGIGYEMMPTVEQCKVALEKAVKQDGLPWPQFLNNEMKEKLDVVKAYNVKAFPTKILIDKNGEIVWKGIGILQENKLDKLLTNIFKS